MINLSGKKSIFRKKAPKGKKTKVTKSNHKEEFNDIILNDLISQDEKSELSLEENSSSNPRNKKKLKLNLGSNKKSSKKQVDTKDNDNLDIERNLDKIKELSEFDDLIEETPQLLESEETPKSSKVKSKKVRKRRKNKKEEELTIQESDILYENNDEIYKEIDTIE